MKRIVVDVADALFSSNDDEFLEAPSLGSCIAIAAYDSNVKAGGLMILMLPSAKEMAMLQTDEYLYMFADTGIPSFFKAAVEHGLDKKQMKVVIAGGGQIMGQSGTSDIGSRNCASAKAAIKKLGVDIALESTGGNINRTLKLEIHNGATTISSPADILEQA